MKVHLGLFQCCGSQPGGEPSPTNINMMGWDKNGQGQWWSILL